MAELLAKVKANLQHPQEAKVLLQWDLNKDQIVPLAEALIEDTRKIYDAVVAAERPGTWDTMIQPLVESDTLFHIVESSCTFVQHVSASKEIRDASTEAEEKLTAFQVETASRFDVYEAIKAFDESKPELEGERRRYVDRTLRNFRRKGMHLDETVRTQVLELNKKIKEMEIKFGKNLGEEDTKLSFAPEALEGLPEDFISRLKKGDDGQYTVTLKYPDYIPIMKMCKVEATRQAMEKAFNSRCVPENVQLLEQLVELRDQVAKLLGFPTHAAYVQDIRMAKNPEAVAKFLTDLSDKLTKLADDEIETLKQFKKREKEAAGEEFDGQLYAWDQSFYRHIVEKEKYSVDHEKIKQYFPLERVTSGLLDIYQELLSLRFTKVDLPVWHEDVTSYEVRDAETDNLVGYFYLDLFPREGKYGHAACWGLQPSCLGPNNERVLPVAALVCNFTKPTESQPSLLLHDEVETFFHEFGHGAHQLCSLADMEMFAGTAVERDFVEAPSQMLENWCWKAESLQRMSGRLEDGAPLPEDMIETLVKARNANAGILNKRQVFLATFDQTIHTAAKADTAAVLSKLSQEICKFDITPGTNFSASFGHLGGGYDAQYYGYLWSEVFSMDMFETRFQAEGISNPKVGRDYREKILRPGGSKDAAEMIRDFLGRDPTPDAFLRSKGLPV